MQSLMSRHVVVALAVSIAAVASPQARADCWDDFDPDKLDGTPVRRMDRTKARDLLVYLHNQGEIVLNDKSGRELNDSKEGKTEYANNAHDQIFDDNCNVKWPGPNDKFWLNQTIAGVDFRYWALGDKNNSRDKPAKKSMNNLDARHAVGVYWLAKKLKDEHNVSELYHAGVGQGTGAAGDAHNDGRAMDFVGVKIGSEQYTVLNDWAQQQDSSGNQPVPGKDYPQLQYRLDGQGTTAEGLFRTVYEFARDNYNDKRGGSQIGQTCEILHPDTPFWGSLQDKKGRAAHQAHLHMDISKAATTY